MPVGELGPDDVATTEPDATLDEAVDTMQTENVGSLVVTENGEPEGIVTDRDVALSVGDVDDPAEEPVESIMTADPATLHEDEEGIEAARKIDETGARRIPIVDDDDQVTGIVTADDVVATVGEQLDDVADTIERQSPDYEP